MLVDEHVPFDIRTFEIFVGGVHTSACIQADDQQGWAILFNDETREYEQVSGDIRIQINTERAGKSEAETREAIDSFNRDVRPRLYPDSILKDRDLSKL